MYGFTAEKYNYYSNTKKWCKINKNSYVRTLGNYVFPLHVKLPKKAVFGTFFARKLCVSSPKATKTNIIPPHKGAVNVTI